MIFSYWVRVHEYSAALWSNFGMDFVGMALYPTADGHSLRIELGGAPGTEAEFNVQVWKLIDSGSGTRPQRILTRAAAAEILTGVNGDGRLSYTIPAIDLSQYKRPGVIITRLDAKEHSDPAGEYTILLRPDGTET